MEKLLIDSRLEKFIPRDDRISWDGGIYSVRFTDIDVTFWFDDISKLQDFLNLHAKERFYDQDVRNGYFDYIDETGSTIRYHLDEVKRGKILVFHEEML
jgi:pyrimidine operon attenuation protein/uracil phosphoribosyltransferase